MLFLVRRRYSPTGEPAVSESNLTRMNEAKPAAGTRRMSAEELRADSQLLPASDLSAGSMAHQLNNMLTVIQGNIALVQMGLRSGDPSTGYLNEAADACHRAASIAAQMLALTRSGEATQPQSNASAEGETMGLVRSETGIRADLQVSPGGLAAEELVPGSGRVLIMDDDSAICALLKHFLEPLGYDVETVEDGARAIAAFKRAKASGRDFHVALLDLDIPGGMGGAEAARRLKDVDRSVRVIATTGRSDSPVLSDLHAHGFDDVALKPWTPAQISRLFSRVLPPSERK